MARVHGSLQRYGGHGLGLGVAAGGAHDGGGDGGRWSVVLKALLVKKEDDRHCVSIGS